MSFITWFQFLDNDNMTTFLEYKIETKSSIMTPPLSQVNNNILYLERSWTLVFLLRFVMRTFSTALFIINTQRYVFVVL